jgi:hypothetical protein
MLRLGAMLVQGARRESPWMPGMASAWLMEGVNHLSAVLVLTWSIAQVPHTEPAGPEAADRPDCGALPGAADTARSAAAAAAALGEADGLADAPPGVGLA